MKAKKHNSKKSHAKKTENELSCLQDPFLNSRNPHYLKDLHSYCANMKDAHDNPTVFMKKKNHARVKLSYGDVRNIGAWSKISSLAQEPMRTFHEIPEDKINDWMKTLHQINATYYHDVANALNIFLLELEAEETNEHPMTEVDLNRYINELVLSIKEAKRDAIRELRKEPRDKAVAKLQHRIEQV
jgi:hypothetical protein